MSNIKKLQRRVNQLENMILSIKRNWQNFTSNPPRKSGWYLMSKGGQHIHLAFYESDNNRWLGESNHHVIAWRVPPLLPWDVNFNIHNQSDLWDATVNVTRWKKTPKAISAISRENWIKYNESDFEKLIKKDGDCYIRYDSNYETSVSAENGYIPYKIMLQMITHYKRIL